MKVLIADDSRSYRFALRQILAAKGFDVVEVVDGEEACRILEGDDPPQLAILDWMMPQLTGPEVCRRLRSRSQDVPYTYLILLTGCDAIEDLKQGLESGADDYVSKPFMREELESRILVGQRHARLHQALAEARSKLWDLSVRDALTGVLNRRGIQQRLESLAAENAYRSRPFSVILSDVDHFKRVNDEFGHQAGDQVLRVLATRMTEAIRKNDEVGRFGGEEFLIVLPGTDHTEASTIAERIRRIVASEPVWTGERMTHVSASFGVASAMSFDFRSISDLLLRADRALYRAKDMGRNRVESDVDLGKVFSFPECASA
ncbi:MAG: diguanylate cyclase [Acidobacteria bacterium]|nr:diguanylate cyclase [Acidobacteriota bacterium]